MCTGFDYNLKACFHSLSKYMQKLAKIIMDGSTKQLCIYNVIKIFTKSFVTAYFLEKVTVRKKKATHY